MKVNTTPRVFCAENEDATAYLKGDKNFTQSHYTRNQSWPIDGQLSIDVKVFIQAVGVFPFKLV